MQPDVCLSCCNNPIEFVQFYPCTIICRSGPAVHISTFMSIIWNESSLCPWKTFIHEIAGWVSDNQYHLQSDNEMFLYPVDMSWCTQDAVINRIMLSGLWTCGISHGNLHRFDNQFSVTSEDIKTCQSAQLKFYWYPSRDIKHTVTTHALFTF